MARTEQKNLTEIATSVQLLPLAKLKLMSVDEQFIWIGKARNLSTAAQVYIGKALKNLKETTNHGEFIPALHKHGWHERTAQNYMKFADFAELIATINPDALSRLDMSQWLAARKELDDDTLKRFIQGEDIGGLTLADASEKSLKELQAALSECSRQSDLEYKKLQRHAESLKAKLADTETKKSTEEAQRKKLQAMLDLRREDSGFPDFYLITREESRAMATQAEMALEQMAALFNEEIQRANHSGNSDDVQHYCERGLATLYSHVYGTACRYAELARRMMESIPLEITDDLGAKLPYTPQEVAIGLERHTMMMAEFKAQASARQDARDDAKPRGKGRPKNKKSEA